MKKYQNRNRNHYLLKNEARKKTYLEILFLAMSAAGIGLSVWLVLQILGSWSVI